MKRPRRPDWPSSGTVLAEVIGYVSERSVRLALTAIVGIVVARHLGPDGLGLLTFAGGVFGLLAPLTLLGLPTILVREFSTGEDWQSLLTSAVAIQIPVALATSAIGFLIVGASRGFEREAVLLALVLLPVPLFATDQSARSYLEATGRVRRIVVAGFSAGVLASAWKIVTVVAEAPVWVIGAAISVEAAVVTVGLFAGLPAGWRPFALPRTSRRALTRRLLGESWPLLLSAIAVTIYMKADLLMLGVIAGDRETGLYAASARLSEVWYFIPAAAAAAVRPRLARMYATGNIDRYRASTQRFMTALTGISLLTLAFVFLASEQIIILLYGSEFLASSPVLRVHVLAAPFVFLGVAGSQWFIDRSMTRAVMVRSTVGAVVNVVLNVVLIPSYGAMGASIATLVAYSMSGVLLNGVTHPTRPLFLLQVRALRLRWPRLPGDGRPPHRVR